MLLHEMSRGILNLSKYLYQLNLQSVFPKTVLSTFSICYSFQHVPVLNLPLFNTWFQYKLLTYRSGVFYVMFIVQICIALERKVVKMSCHVLLQVMNAPLLSVCGVKSPKHNILGLPCQGGELPMVQAGEGLSPVAQHLHNSNTHASCKIPFCIAGRPSCSAEVQ